jgi:hypothetical protein
MSTGWLPSIDRRAVIVFALLTILLLAPWPGWGRRFGAGFSCYGNGLVALTEGGGAAPRFRPSAPHEVSAADGGDWAVVLTLGEQVFPLDTRIIAYTPLAIFLALALATPVARRRKAAILAGGFAFLLARLAFAVLVPLQRGSEARSLVGIAWTVLIATPVMSYASPLAVWWVAVALTTPRGQAPGARRRRAAPSVRRRAARP